jgi:cytochrome P450
MAALPDEMRPLIQETVLSYFRGYRSGSTIDLYESTKELSWKLILGIFMSSFTERDQAQKDQAEIEALQEDLLRGQFSLFPVGINLGLWRSPRARGLAARKKLQQLLQERVQKGVTGCPFATQGEADQDDVANHLLLFTSSLAVKSLASLLTAVMLNLYTSSNSPENQSSQSPASTILSLENASHRDELLKSVILETERLSPPVVGIMRRTIQDVTLLSGQESIQDTIIPKGWDVWLYFVGAARDRASFGDTADSFLPERFYGLSEGTVSEKKGFAFGAGAKSCLGESLMREVVLTVTKTCLGTDSESKTRIELQCNAADIPKGVQGWLGWQKDVTPEEWSKDMKQLPTQRPVKGLMVTIIHTLDAR